MIQLPPVSDVATKVRLGERHAEGADIIVRRFAVSGGLVCDPLLHGGATNALAASRNRNRFLGASADQSRFEYVRDRLAREDGRQANIEGPEQNSGEENLDAGFSGQQLSLEG